MGKSRIYYQIEKRLYALLIFSHIHVHFYSSMLLNYSMIAKLQEETYKPHRSSKKYFKQ